MAFLWGSATSTQFDQLLEQCTSDLLPAKSPLDLDAALRLADAVRSASVPPAEAALKLVTRLGHDNPNVQLLALQLADVLVKNAGNQFLKAFASSATAGGGAVNELEHLCSSSRVNRDVQLAARQKLQEWASAFEASGRPLLSQSDLVKLYHRLRATPAAVPFPAPADAHTTAAMVDSLSAPDWSDSPYCTRCRTEFSTFNRKHHCRNCGHVFDQQCSSQRMPLPHYGITTESVRVCDACAKQIKQGKGAHVARTILQQQQQQQADPSGATTTTTTRRRAEEEEEDADLQRAIQASLAESTSAASHGPVRSPPPATAAPVESGYRPSYASQIQSSSSDSKKGKEEEEDPDLAAAIAASLKDLEAAPPPPAASSSSRPPRASAPAPAPAQTYSDLFPSSSDNNNNRAATTTTTTTTTGTGTGTAFHLPSYDLTPDEQSHLSQFLLSSSSPSSAYSASTPESYRLVSEVLQPKLDRSWRDARTRGQILREMEAKLSEAARLYGAGLLLTERVMGQGQQPQPQSQQAYRSPSYSNPTASLYTPHQDPAAAATRYQYAPPPLAAAAGIGYGQPLPAYAVPAVVVPPPQTADAALASVAVPTQQQQQEYAATPLSPSQQQQHQQQPQPQQPAGFYKPSQFPPVPQTDPTPNPHYAHSHPQQSVLGLPNVPRENPWKNTHEEASDRREEEEEGEEQRQKVGELIEL